MPLAQIYKGRHRSVFYFGGLLKVRGAVGVSVEANFDAVCCLDVVDSNSRSCAFLCVGCFLLFAFEDILSPPAATHKHTFRAGVGNKIQQPKWSEPKEYPLRSTAFCIHLAFGVSTRGAAVRQQLEPLPFFFVRFQVSHFLQQALTRQHYGECDGMRDILLCVCADLKVAEVNRNAAGLWVTAVSEHLPKSPAHLWVTRHEQVTAVINICIPTFALLVSLQTSSWRM